MELGFALKPSADGTAQTPASESSGDWLGLRARLVAAHGARRAMLGEFAGTGRIGGSFAPSAALALAISEEDLSRVNRTGLANGKCLSGIDVNLAAHDEPGERGK